MIYHRSEREKPFKIGQLIRCTGVTYDYLCVVLELRWDARLFEWQALLLYQDNGKTDWQPTKYFDAAGKFDDNL